LSAEGAATLSWGTRVANAETGALVGGSLGFACGFLEGYYRKGNVEDALKAGENEALIGGGAGLVFGFAGAATSVWARYLNGIFLLGGGALALNHIYQGEDLVIKSIRTACGVIGLGIGVRTLGKSNFPANYFDDLARAGTVDPDSLVVVLGKFSRDGATYIDVAISLKATFLQVKYWLLVGKVLTLAEAWEINKAFLKQQIREGKQFILSHDPSEATGFFLREVAYLEQLGFRFMKDGLIWRAIR
jgi:hypothetical protein